MQYAFEKQEEFQSADPEPHEAIDRGNMPIDRSLRPDKGDVPTSQMQVIMGYGSRR